MKLEAQPGGKLQMRFRWRLRDSLAAAFLFAFSAAFVLWQNTRVAVLWDLGYLLDTAWRIALGQMPYRDFPLAHAPLTFVVQAALIKLFGRHYIVPVVYAAVAGGFGAVLAWRIVLRTLDCARDRPHAWSTSLLLSAPLIVTGVYAIYPHPIYDCDCALAILLAVWLLLRMEGRAGWLNPFFAGTVCVLPVFFKQNMGLPFLAAVAAGMLLLMLSDVLRERSHGTLFASQPALVLTGIAAALAAAAAVLACSAGLSNYFHWTVSFAAARRMPGLGSLAAVYAQPSFAWTLPATAAGLALCATRFIARAWVKAVAFACLSAPLAWSLIFLFLEDDSDTRTDNLLALWPLWLLVSFAAALVALRRGVTLPKLMPFFVLAAIHGAFLSQQLWGSTYALWPLLTIAIAQVLSVFGRKAWPLARPMSAIFCATFAICGGLYAASLERLNYIDIPDTPLAHAQTPSLRGMASPGQYLPNLDELIEFAGHEIPPADSLVLLPGEGPFYYATGRTPQFPVTLFDPATDPYSPVEVVAESRRRNVQWVIVKRVLQSRENPMPQADETMRLVAQGFVLYRRLTGYDVYRRR
jgi:energy-converting hydrogenase Eha subunit A